MKTCRLSWITVPKMAVLTAGLVAATLVATVGPLPAQATPSRARDCTGCHGSGSVGGTVRATPSTTTPMVGAAYTVAITAPAGQGQTGYWIANSNAAGVTGTTTGVRGGPSSAASYTAAMRAPTTTGTYYYKVWADRGSDDSSGVTNFRTYRITVRASTPPIPPPPTQPVAVTRVSDFNRDGRTDLVARNSAGQLWLYPGNGTGGLLPRQLMANGWNVFAAIVTPGDVTGDGNGDVLARNAAGQLRLYPGNGRGGFLVSRLVGISGWNAMTALTAAGDMTGDTRPDVLARDRAGRLWLYPMVGTGSFQARRLLGASGWNAMTAVRGAGDLSGDGRADVLARDGAGKLWLYRGNGTSRLAARTQAGTGWQGMTALVTPGNWNRAGGNDLLARDGAGTLWLYPGNNAGRFVSRQLVVRGWQAMRSID